MGTDIVASERRYRKQIPEEYRSSLDTRVYWLWNQSFGTVQAVSMESSDALDVTAATLFLQAIMAGHMDSIALILRRLEGGAIMDEELLAKKELRV